MPRGVAMTKEQLARAEELLNEGCSYLEVSRTIGIAEFSIRLKFPGRGWTQEQKAEHKRLNDLFKRLDTIWGLERAQRGERRAS
ncbi:helix-turn-helix DNA binding domain protein [Mycobacterium phage Benzema]|nr:helix-turn-helix DNA binding domain protein [Mycobacterium phage Benzema]